jgi:predicted transport protein
MAKSPEEMVVTMINNLKANTGKTLPQWLKVAAASKLARHGELVTFLKTEHGVTHGYANLIVSKYLEGVKNPGGKGAGGTRAGGPASAAGGDDLLAAQYAGDKAALRPIYDALAKHLRKFGADVEFAPKKTYVSLRRNKQFALIQPSTKTRVDVGINLKGRAAEDRLEASGSFNSMVSHRVRVTDVSQVDAPLIDWLRQAYEQA